MRRLTIDVVGAGIQSGEMPISRTVRGEVRIDTGSVSLDEVIEGFYRDANQKAYEFLQNPLAKTLET